jgi:diaminohydroxyphosphoribosylaminopyrimidine deaminase/5-amino-6-(5-phosphoribosylamino)uracil reductase
VVVGAVDPDARHGGRGLELLGAAGIEVELLGVGSRELPGGIDPHFERWNRHERLRRPRPWTLLKWAQTRTGQLVPPPDVGGGRWVSSPDALREVQLLRGRVDAIVTGVGTVLADDPRLTVRPPGDGTRPPRRVVLDGLLRTPLAARLLADPATLGEGEAGGAVTLLARAGLGGGAAGRRRELLARGVEVIGMPTDEAGQLSLREVQSWLAAEGLRRVLVEAGPTLLESHLEQGFCDQLRVYTGEVNGGRGRSMAPWFARLRLLERLDREAGPDAVLEAFLDA